MKSVWDLLTTTSNNICNDYLVRHSVVVVFILRPLVVWISSWRSDLNWREKAFVAWIGPKGIVAAAVASLFSLYLMSDKISLPNSLR